MVCIAVLNLAMYSFRCALSAGVSLRLSVTVLLPIWSVVLVGPNGTRSTAGMFRNMKLCAPEE